jgi:hypothetical protein
MGKKRGPTPRDFCIKGGSSQGFATEEKISRSAERFQRALSPIKT